MVLCIHRAPRSDTTSYLTNVEEELNSFHSWALSQRQTLVTRGDLNLDRLQPESAKRRVLLDLEDIFRLECLIKEPTRKKALLDVILTNKPEMFDQSGVVEFGLSDHQMIYTFLKPNVKHHPAKVISFRSTKHLDPEALRADVSSRMRTLELDTCESIRNSIIDGTTRSPKFWIGICRSRN